MAERSGTVLRISRFSVHDGPGIRTTVFLKGCPLRCLWCHSPESQNRRPELLLHPERCSNCGTCLTVCPSHASEAIDGRVVVGSACTACGTCVEHCPQGAREVVGETTTVSALLRVIEKDRLFYDDSGGGVTFSGGEPLLQAGFLAELIRACRGREIHTAVDTSGYAPARTLSLIRPDLFLFDLKMIDEAAHRTATGVSNRRILANAKTLVEHGAVVRFRFPLIPGINDAPAELHALGAFVRSLGHREIDLLPYHRAGIAKYARLNRSYPLTDTEEPTADEVAHARRVIAEAGVETRVGGLRDASAERAGTRRRRVPAAIRR